MNPYFTGDIRIPRNSNSTIETNSLTTDNLNINEVSWDRANEQGYQFYDISKCIVIGDKNLVDNNLLFLGVTRPNLQNRISTIQTISQNNKLVLQPIGSVGIGKIPDSDIALDVGDSCN